MKVRCKKGFFRKSTLTPKIEQCELTRKIREWIPLERVNLSRGTEKVPSSLLGFQAESRN